MSGRQRVQVRRRALLVRARAPLRAVWRMRTSRSLKARSEDFVRLMRLSFELELVSKAASPIAKSKGKA